MKKLYLPLVAVAALLALSITVVAAPKPIITFDGSSSDRWGNTANWSLNRLPQDGDSIIIPAGQTPYIGNSAGGFTSTLTITLNNVIIVIKKGGKLQLGNGNQVVMGTRQFYYGVLALNSTSVVSLQQGSGSGTGINAPGQVTANPISNTTTGATSANNQITIGGVLKFGGNTTYSITGSGTGFVNGPSRTSQLTGSGANGFTMGALPVVLVGFNANLATDNKVTVQWSTQQEVSTDHFEIQRSSDGLGWQTIANVKASGYSSTQKNYSFVDPTPQTGTNLYRLRMIDFDANFGFSGVVNVRLNIFGKVSVFPNPSVNSVNVSLGHVPASSWTLSLLNQSGQVMIRKTYSRDVTNVTLPVSIYPAGNYSIDITDGVSRQSSRLLIAHQ